LSGRFGPASCIGDLVSILAFSDFAGIVVPNGVGGTERFTPAVPHEVTGNQEPDTPRSMNIRSTLSPRISA
jgi:hypothetical protein